MYIRIGKCEPDKCGNACCKAFWNQEGFKDGVCPKLKNGQCSIYKDRPQGCKDFPPSEDDELYQRVKNKCTYKFIIN